VSQAAFESYYQGGEAETWELLALTRARIVWSTSQAFADDAHAAIETALRRPRSRRTVAKDVREMRALLERERPPSGPWDLKLSPGGLVDVEFAAQFLQIVHASEGGPLAPNTAAALAAIGGAKLADPQPLAALAEAWRLEQDLTQLLKVALGDKPDPDNEPKAFQALLARAGEAKSYKALKARLAAAQSAARTAYGAVVKP